MNIEKSNPVKSPSYDAAYAKFTPNWFDAKNLPAIDRYLNENSDSLRKFIGQYLDQFQMRHGVEHMNILELGCGLGGLSHYLKSLSPLVTGVDISDLAIMGAREIALLKNTDILFKKMDIRKDEELNQKYDLIVDSHLYHCLTSKEDRAAYLSFVKKHLKPGGKFLMECMVFQKRIQTPIGFMFGQDYNLYKEIDGAEMPVRSVRKSIDIEEDFKAEGFQIDYLYYHNELAFEVFDEYIDYPLDFLPKTLRLSCTL